MTYLRCIAFPWLGWPTMTVARSFPNWVPCRVSRDSRGLILVRFSSYPAHRL